MKTNRSDRQLAAPRWTNHQISEAAGRLIVRYEEIVGRDYILLNGLRFNDVYEKLIYPVFKVELYEDEDLGFDPDGRKLLGRYDVRNNCAHLDSTVSEEGDDPRRAFTCWHEVAGHGVLQGQWLRGQLERIGGREVIEVTERSMSVGTEQRLERQANFFASQVAAPSWLVNYAIRKTFRPKGKFFFREPCLYWLDVQGLRVSKFIVDSGDLCSWIASKISGYFGGLSAESIGYRIAELGWVDDRTTPDLHLHRTVRNRRPVGNLMTV